MNLIFGAANLLLRSYSNAIGSIIQQQDGHLVLDWLKFNMIQSYQETMSMSWLNRLPKFIISNTHVQAMNVLLVGP